MGKVNALFQDECAARGEALIAAGMDPEDAHDAVFPPIPEFRFRDHCPSVARGPVPADDGPVPFPEDWF